MSTGHEVPPTRHEMLGHLEGLLQRLNEQTTGFDLTKALFDQRLEDLEREREAAVGPKSTQIAELRQEIIGYANLHRPTLLSKQHGKAISLPSGRIAWRIPSSGIKFLVPEEQIVGWLRKTNRSHLITRLSAPVIHKRLISKFPSLAARMEYAGLIKLGDGQEKLYIYQATQKSDDRIDTKAA